jgi:general secretion pathway protein F/type IV pilus assembly protein PilC
MSLFKYTALLDKKKVKGIIEAKDTEEAKNILYKKNLVVIRLHSFNIEKNLKISKKELLSFTQEIAKLLHAGLSLYEALFALLEKYENQKIYPLILNLCNQTKRGKSFSMALSLYPKIFDFLYCSMVANAEKTGSLASALDEIATILKKHQKLKKRVTSALLYPSILSLFCFGVISILIFFVIPSLFELFEGKNLHPLTKIVLSISKIANDGKYFIFVLFILFLFFMFFGIYSKKLKKNLYTIILRFPYVKTLMGKIAIVRFSRSFSILLKSGVSYIEALKLSKRVMKHPILEKEMEIAEKKITQGEKLSKCLKNSKNIPALVVRLLEIAEESAKTSSMLSHIATIYEEELENNLSKITTLVQPLLLVILGIVVGFIVLAVLLPLTDVSAFVS